MWPGPGRSTNPAALMKFVYFITHPEVIIDPAVPVTQWPLADKGKERLGIMLDQPWIFEIGSVYCSAEQKAIDGAAILGEFVELDYQIVPELGELDRSSTGYLPHAEHEAAANDAFAHPDESSRGWEIASAAQKRILKAVRRLIRDDQSHGHIAIVSHGAVGAFLLCDLKGVPISRVHDQPGSGGGNYFAFRADNLALLHDWRPIDSEAAF